MPTEIFTRKAYQVAEEVRAKFGDSSKVRLRDEMLLRWINMAAAEISRQNPWLESTASCNIVSGIGKYEFASHFPGLRVQRLDMALVNGVKAEIVPFAELQERIARPGAKDAAGTPVALAEYGGAFTLWPTPTESSVDGLVLYFIAYPPDVADLNVNTTLNVPDRFYNAVVDYVHQQALEYDDNFEAAEVKRGHFELGMQRELHRAADSPGDFYPTITDIDEDDFGPSTGSPRGWRI